jgi:Arylsulfotransferase (ASST)
VRRTSGRFRARAALGSALALLAVLAFAPATAGAAATAAQAGTVAPGASALTLSPPPGAVDASPMSQISLKGVPVAQIRVISVAGSRSGGHAGRLAPYAAEPGASFLPTHPFTPGERVTVRLAVLGMSPISYSFLIAHPAPLSIYPGPAVRYGTIHDIQSFHSRPDLGPPDIAARTLAPGADPGDVFIDPTSGPGQYGPMIFDPSGALVWFHPLGGGQDAEDFRVQQYRGKPVLTWWQGYLSQLGYGAGEDVIADSSYRAVAIVKAGNGYSADLHEFLLTGSGTALITIFDPVLYNDSAVHGGRANDAVTDSVMQEVDVRTGLVMFEWHALDHVAVTESEAGLSSVSGYPFDYFHLNSIQETGSDFLISARNTWTDYEIDGHSGAVLWRLGGKHSSFTMGPGTLFAWGHDVHLLPDGDLSEFDDGAVPRIHSQSRGMVIHVDGTTGIATLVREYDHPKPLLTGSQGSFQTLDNGDAFLGWGAQPYFSEFSPDGRLLFDANMPHGYQSYRAYRAPWIGTPPTAPDLAGSRGRHNALTLYASWNGATNVAAWQVLAGSRPGSLRTVSTFPRAGFETAMALSSSARYMAVRALSTFGKVLGTSRTIRP